MNTNSTEAEIAAHNAAAERPTEFQQSGVFQQNESFDETEYYKTEIEPLVKQIFDKCQDKGIPMFCLVNPAMDGTAVAGNNSRVFRGHALANGNGQVLLLSELCRPENQDLAHEVFGHLFGDQMAMIAMLDKIQAAGEAAQ